MKTTLKKLLVLILALSCTVGLVSCAAKPELDLEEAMDNLEDKGYSVSYAEDDETEPGIVEELYASDDDSNSISIVRFEKSSTAKLYYKAYKAENEAKIDDYNATLKLYKHILNTYDDDLDSDDIDQLEKAIDEYEDLVADFKEKNVIGISGKVVWFGTKDAVEDSK